MPKFLDPLWTEKIGPRKWKLLKDFHFRSDRFSGTFYAPTGMETNFASIPRVLWILYPPVGAYDPAAVIHDACYQGELHNFYGQRVGQSKYIGDQLFKEGLSVLELSNFSKFVMYQAVDKFGKI